MCLLLGRIAYALFAAYLVYRAYETRPNNNSPPSEGLGEAKTQTALSS